MPKKYSLNLLLKKLVMSAAFVFATSTSLVWADSCQNIESACFQAIGGPAPYATWWYHGTAVAVCTAFKDDPDTQRLCIEKMTAGQWSSQNIITPQALCINTTVEMRNRGKCS